MPLDAAADSNHQQLYRYHQLGLVPDWVKNAANAFPTKQAAAIPISAFGDVRTRQYRCDTPAATYLSALYFLDQQDQYPAKTAGWIRARIEQAAERWQIRNAYNDLRTKLARLRTRDAVTLSADDFALPDSRQYPLRNAKEVRAAAQWLAEHRDKIPYGDRYTIAGKIIEKAAAFGASLGPQEAFVARQAGLGFCSAQEAAQLIRLHVKAAARAAPEDAASMLKLAATVEASPEFVLDHQGLVGLAKTVDLFDRATGLIAGYGELLKRAEDVLFSTLYSEVQEIRKTACQLVSGSVYEPAQFNKLAVDDLRALFGDEFVAGCTQAGVLDTEKLAELAQTLPFADAQAFDRLLEEAGHSPVFKRAGFRVKFNREALAAAAAAYGE